MTDKPAKVKVFTPGPRVLEHMERFLEAYVSEPSCFGDISKTMKHVGVPRQHFSDRWMKNPQFAERFEDTKALFKGDVRVALHYLALVKGNPHAIIHLDKKVNREDYEHEKSGSSGISITINMPGVGEAATVPLADVASDDVLEAQGFVVRSVEYQGRELGILEPGEEWDIDADATGTPEGAGLSTQRDDEAL